MHWLSLLQVPFSSRSGYCKLCKKWWPWRPECQQRSVVHLIKFIVDFYFYLGFIYIVIIDLYHLTWCLARYFTHSWSFFISKFLSFLFLFHQLTLRWTCASMWKMHTGLVRGSERGLCKWFDMNFLITFYLIFYAFISIFCFLFLINYNCVTSFSYLSDVNTSSWSCFQEKNRINKDGEIVISSTKTRTQK